MSEVQANDYPAMWELWLSTGWNEGYQIDCEGFVTAWENCCFKTCLHHDGQLVAMARANSDGVLYAMIHDVVVHPDFRGQGLGQKVVQSLLSDLQAHEIRCVQLMAAAGQSGFYQRLGFVERAVEKPGMQLEDKPS